MGLDAIDREDASLLEGSPKRDAVSGTKRAAARWLSIVADCGGQDLCTESLA